LQRQRAGKDQISEQVLAEVVEIQGQSLQSHVMILTNQELVLQGIDLASIGQGMMTLKIETGEEIDDRLTGDETKDRLTDLKADGVPRGLVSHQNALDAHQISQEDLLSGQENLQSVAALEMMMVKEKGALGLILTRLLTSKEDSKGLVMILKVVGALRVTDQCHLVRRAGRKKRMSPCRRNNEMMTEPQLLKVAGEKVHHLLLHLILNEKKLPHHPSK
jgi:hypothetical protein